MTFRKSEIIEGGYQSLPVFLSFPFLNFSDHQLLSPVAVAGLMGCVVACLDVKTTLLGKSHYLLYSLATAIQVNLTFFSTL